MTFTPAFDTTVFEARTEHGMHMLVRREGASAIVRALAGGHGAPEPGGRGAVARFPWLPGRDGLVRRCRRGGIMRFMGGNYLLENRPLREFQAHCGVVGRGLSAPLPLGVAWTRLGPAWRGALATEALDAPDLLAWLRAPENNDFDVRAALLRRCGALVREMHEAGVWHADLQVKNLLAAAPGPVLIDFDRARVSGKPGDLARARNLLRFRRSLERHGLDGGLFAAFIEGYGPAALPGWMDTAYRLRGAGRRGGEM